MSIVLTDAITPTKFQTFSAQATTQQAVDTYLDSYVRKALKTPKARIFLSHSHIDVENLAKNQIYDLIKMLIALSYDVYIDWLDPEMPMEPNKETANRLKAKIDECDRFLLVATTNAINSRWVPWELGYADKSKTVNNIAVIPIADQNGKWEGAEYIGLYPRAVISATDNLAVFPPSSTSGYKIGYWMAKGASW